MVVHEKIESFELLRAVYAPQNIYCVHVDASPELSKRQSRPLFPASPMSSWPVSWSRGLCLLVQSAGRPELYGRLAPELSAMEIAPRYMRDRLPHKDQCQNEFLASRC